MIKKHDLTGQKFGNLTVLGLKSKTKKRGLRWKVQCDCGKKIILATPSVKRGVGHCGCKTVRYRAIKHGMYGTKIYNTWARMKQRCEDPNHSSYNDYGGRGITVYEPWSKSFLSFYKSVGDIPNDGDSIDRIDNNKGYEPGNIRWASKTIQANNRRSNKRIKYGNEVFTVGEWAAKLGINYATLYDRIYKHKWPLEKAFETYGRK